ncbi:MAG: hypothetical protein KJS79_12535 [Rhodospirillales bacterium]|nr:hypothetical protein [Rhodospirillales bacterium]MDE2328470.1 hypothetical protein [Rhodospirillales bacterium]
MQMKHLAAAALAAAALAGGYAPASAATPAAKPAIDIMGIKFGMTPADVRQLIGAHKDMFPNAAIQQGQYRMPDGKTFVADMTVTSHSDPRNFADDISQTIFIQYTSPASGNKVVAVNREATFPSDAKDLGKAPGVHDLFAAMLSQYGTPDGFTIGAVDWTGANPAHKLADNIYTLQSGCISGAFNAVPSQLYNGSKDCPQVLQITMSANNSFGGHVQFLSELMLDAGSIYSDIAREREAAASQQAKTVSHANQQPAAKPSL